MADVCRQGDNTLNSRTVPVIFVPGVMGSRLYFPSIDQYWDPDSSWRMFHWVRTSATDERDEIMWNNPVTIMTTGDKLSAAELAKGYASVAAGFYVGFLRFLVGLKTLCAKTPVYAVGYDWRQSNRDSATYLDGQITSILAKEKAKEFILITHSMGGIVARACLLANAAGNSAKLLGVIHVFQPASGAPVFYRRMYTGAVSKWDGGWGLSNIQGTTPHDFATVLSALRGPCELVPTDAYLDTGGNDWLWDDRTTPPTSWSPPIFPTYASASAPPGMWWSIAGETPTETDLKSRISEASTFHSWLGRYRHSNTWALYSTGVVTDMAARFNNATAYKGIVAQRRAEGDGTVPATSGSSLFASLATSTDTSGAAFISNTSLRQCQVSGVEHAAACGNSTVQTVIDKMLQVALRCCGDVNPPADIVTPDGPLKPGEEVASADDTDSQDDDSQVADAETSEDDTSQDDTSQQVADNDPADAGDDSSNDDDDDSSDQTQVADADAPAPEDWDTA